MMDFRSIRVNSLSLLMPLLLSACKFTADNKPGKNSYKLSSTTSNNAANCGALKDVKEILETLDIIDCLLPKILSNFDKIKGQKNQELGNRELLALVNDVVFKNESTHEKLKQNEIDAALLLKQSVSGGSALSIKRQEISAFAEDFKIALLRSHLADFNIFSERVDTEGKSLSELKALIEQQSKEKQKIGIYTFLAAAQRLLRAKIEDATFENIQLNPEHIKGVFNLARRAPIPKAFEALKANFNDHNADIVYEAFAIAVGYAPKSPIPLGLVRDVISPSFANDGTDKSIEKHPFYDKQRNGYQLPNMPTEIPLQKSLDYLELVKQDTEAYNNILRKLLGFDRDSKIGVDRIEKLLALIKSAQIVAKNGKPLTLDFEPADLAQKIMAAKHHLLGGSSKFIDAADFEAALKLKWISQVTRLINMPIYYDEAIPANLKRLIDDPIFWNYAEKRKTALISNEKWNLSKLVRGVISIGTLGDDYLLLRAVSSVLMAFDKNANDTIEADYESPSNELKAMLRSFAFLGDIAAIITAKSEEDKKSDLKDIQDSQFSLNKILNNNMLLGSLVFYADNLSSASNSDGSINSGEFIELFDLVSDISNYSQFNQYIAREYINGHIELLFNSNKPVISDYHYQFVTNVKDSISLLEEFLPSLRCKRLRDYNGPAYDLSATAYVFHFDPKKWDGDVRDKEKFLEISNVVWPYYGLFERAGLYSEDKHIERSAIVHTWLKLSDAIFNERYPVGVTNSHDLRKTEYGNSSNFYNCLPPEATPAKLYFGDLQNFFAKRLNAAGYTWLSKRLQLMAVIAPENVSRDLLSNMIWRAPEFQIDISHAKKNNPKLNMRDIAAILFKVRAPIDTSKGISRDELSRRVMLLSEVIGTIMDAAEAKK